MRLLVLSVLSVVLMVVDARMETLNPFRSSLALVLTPFYWMADMPGRLWIDMNQKISTRSD